jgi:Domain of unknown function (DUF4160)
MPRVHVLSNHKVKIYVHARGEHPPPHFHLVGPDCDANIDIQTLVVTKGDAPSALLAEARAWARENQAVLLEAWRKYNEPDG